MGRPVVGCGTCKARKIRCDGALPVCRRCSRAGRPCDGYDRSPLFWPRGNDKRRAIVGPAPRQVTELRFGKATFVHTLAWDVAVHDYVTAHNWDGLLPTRLSGFIGSESHGIDYRLLPSIGWLPQSIDATGADLLQYFEAVLGRTLKAIHQDRMVLCSTILRLAFSNGSSASMAVTQALLALSATARKGRGHQTQASQHKLAAIRALRESATADLSGQEITQHIAASMLLCSSENPYPDGLSHTILRNLVEIIKTMMRPSERTCPMGHDKIEAENLKRKILNATTEAHTPTSAIASPIDRSVEGLLRLASLIYLERRWHNTPEQTEELTGWVDQGFLELGTLEVCPWPFILLIFACEARSDHQRRVLLDVIVRTEEMEPMNNLDQIKAMIRFAWVQEDLGSWTGSYHQMMRLIVSTSETLPILL
ncbi:Beauvericin cluster-specific repressor BEA4 [Paramyrothecium foliicola]|nr:Beauvericin cluster-specific repressor BEA4 [Paramyrothecium foliicola]